VKKLRDIRKGIGRVKALADAEFHELRSVLGIRIGEPSA
jgi:hypothetical protein